MTVTLRALVPTAGATGFRGALLLCAFVALSLLPRAALALQPKDPEQVCRRISTNSGEAECLRIIEGRFVDPLAAAACDRIPSNQATIACMRAISGRRLSQQLILICDAEPSSWGTVRCFGGDGERTESRHDSGGWHRGGQRPVPPDGYGGSREGGCNQWGCFRNGGGCNQWGCWHSPSGSCNQWGCSNYGGCNQWGCWQTSIGSCNQWGCSNYGTCNQWGCPRR